MIYITGDLHADLVRLKKSRGIRKLRKNDTLIVCGDFGFIWNGSPREQRVLNWLGRRRYNLLFVEGTHDNLDLLEGYPLVDYCAGQARRISGRCHQLLRGEIYQIEEKTFFTFGGGESPDADVRRLGETWWPGELPTMEELEQARAHLAEHGNAVDYIITHSASTKVHNFLDMDDIHINHLGAFFDEISRTVRYKQWYLGRYHLDKVIPPLHRLIYQEILPVK